MLFRSGILGFWSLKVVIDGFFSRKDLDIGFKKSTFITIAEQSSSHKVLHEAVKRLAVNARSLKYLLGWLIAGTRGGPTRAKIIEALKESPQNANQLATLLKMDYKTMRHHLDVLEKNRMLTSVGDRYGATYFLSQTLEDNYALFEEIVKKIGKK